VGVFLVKIFGKERAKERRNENIIVSGTLIKSFLIRTDCVYKIWKAKLLDISEFRSILIDLIKIDRYEGIEYFNKHIEMVKDLKDIDIIKLVIEKAVLSYSNSKSN